MKINLSNPDYAKKLNELGFTYSYSDSEKGKVVYTHADQRLVGMFGDFVDDMECVAKYSSDIGKPETFTFKNLRNGVTVTIKAEELNDVEEIII